MALPIVPGSEVATPSSQVQINPAPFRQAALAKGQVAGAIGQDVGGFFGDVAKKFQDNRNARTILEADLAMRKTTDEYRDSLAKNPDESTWLPGYQERTQALREQIMSGPNVGPDVKRRLGMMFDRWEGATTAEIRTAAQVQSLNRTKHAVISDYTYAARQGDEKGANAAIDYGVKSYALFPEDAARMRQQLPGIAQKAQADTAIETNPILAHQLLTDLDKNGRSKKWPGIDPRTLVTLTTTANAAKNRVQAENGQQILEDIDASSDGTVDPKMLAAKVKSGEITQRFAENVKNMVAKRDTAKARDNFNLLWMDVQQHDFTANKTPDEDARKFKDEAAALPEEFRKRAYSFIDNRLAAAKKEGKSEERPVETRTLADLQRDFDEKDVAIPVDTVTTPGTPEVTHWFRANEPGTPATVTHSVIPGGMKWLRSAKTTDAMVAEKYGKGVTKDQVIEGVRQHQANILQELTNWFKDPANKDATYEQASEYRAKLELPYQLGAAGAMIATAHANQSPLFSPQDMDAWNWAQANQSDPRAQAAMKQILAKYQARENDTLTRKVP